MASVGGTLRPPSLPVSSAFPFRPLFPPLPSPKVRPRPLQLLHCLCLPALRPACPLRPLLSNPVCPSHDPCLSLLQAPLCFPYPLPSPPVLFSLPSLRPPRRPTGLRALLYVCLRRHARVLRLGPVHHPHCWVRWRWEWWDDWRDGWRDDTSPSSHLLPWEHR